MAVDGRAQTTIDFAIGMGVFLVALTTVVAFMPTMIGPFTGAQANPLAADRLAVQVVDSQLGDPSEPSKLNATCTMFFFNESGTPADPCESFDPTDDATTKLGVSDETFVNVSLKRNVSGTATPDTLCGDGSGNIDPDCSGGGPVLAIGPEPPTGSGSVTSARRIALLDDDNVFVVVKVWT